MLGEGAKGSRRKLRAARRGSFIRRTRRAGRVAGERQQQQLHDTASAVTSVCAAAATGLELCARRTGDETTAVAAKSAAAFLRQLVEAVVEAADREGLDARPRARTGERLRWEWLASTATVVDGTPDRRLLSECARILSEVMTKTAGSVEVLGAGIAARLRVASAEAYSLSSALEYRHHGELALAFT